MPELSRWSRALDLSDSMVAAVRATLFAPRAWADRPGIGIGPYLRERRLAGNCTLSRAAVELGLPLATLGHYESGRVEVPMGVLSNLVERFAVGAVERSALCDGPSAFLEWCDSLVERPDKAMNAVAKAAHATTPAGLLDRGPAFIRLRTGLLRVRIRGDAWAEADSFATNAHAHWLAVGERRTEAAATLASVDEPALARWPLHKTIYSVARRYVGRIRAEELLLLADSTKEAAQAAWLRSEAAFDLCERRQKPEAKRLAERAKTEADAIGGWTESWMRRRDAVRVALRLRDWAAVEAELDAMDGIHEGHAGDWYSGQRDALRSRLVANEATARSAGP